MDKVFGLFGSRKRVAQVVHDDVQILKDTQHRTPSPAGSIAPGPPQSPSPLGGSPAREQGDTSAALVGGSQGYKQSWGRRPQSSGAGFCGLCEIQLASGSPGSVSATNPVASQ